MKKVNVMILVILLAIGFATVSTTLILNGLISIGESNDFKIIFTSAKIDGIKRNAVIGSDKTTITYETRTLTSINDESVLDYEVTNTSRNYDADVSIGCNIVDNNGDIMDVENSFVNIVYEPESMTISSGETKSGKITVKLVRLVEEDMDIKIKCALTGSAKGREILGDEYVEPFSKASVMMAPPYKSFNTTEKFWNYKANITKVIFENDETL